MVRRVLPKHLDPKSGVFLHLLALLSGLSQHGLGLGPAGRIPLRTDVFLMLTEPLDVFDVLLACGLRHLKDPVQLERRIRNGPRLVKGDLPFRRRLRAFQSLFILLQLGIAGFHLLFQAFQLLCLLQHHFQQFVPFHLSQIIVLHAIHHNSFSKCDRFLATKKAYRWLQDLLPSIDRLRYSLHDTQAPKYMYRFIVF